MNILQKTLTGGKVDAAAANPLAQFLARPPTITR